MKKLYFFAFILVSLAARSQDPRTFLIEPQRFWSSNSILELPVQNSTELWSMANESDKNGTLPIYGKIIEFPMNLMEVGNWTHYANGDALLTFTVKSEGALSMDIFFQDFYIPEGAEFYVSSGDRHWFAGPFNHDENQESGFYRTPEVFGDVLVFEYFVPSGVMESAKLNIRGFGHYFRFVHDDFFERASDPCEVDVKCPEGNNWSDEMRSVVKLSIPAGGGVGLCTGTLVNNTSYDCKNYVLTAMHCTEQSVTSDFAQVVVRFNYQRTSCGSGISASAQQKTGTTRRADSNDAGGSSGSDFCLLEMTQAIPTAWNPYYAGWDASSSTPSASPEGWKVICIHHPAGDVKKISTAGTCVSGTWQAAGHHWKVNWIQTVTNWGVTEGGSSGSPIFNKDHRIVGTLTGGSSYCDTPSAPDYYGKMDKHWTGNPNPSNEDLVDWLDAAGTGLVQINGSYVGSSLSQPCFGVVSVEESILYSDLNIYPTQALNELTIECNRFDEIKGLNVYSQDGKFVKQLTLNSSKMTVVISDLSTGVYFIQVIRKDGSAFNKKFVKL
ncbi:MAG: trypsin-like peptidase domain-containing protein [Bacteroidota bacterium]